MHHVSTLQQPYYPRTEGHLRVEVEFSLALCNRTGKYFMCRDMIEDLGSSVNDVRYWRTRATRTPTGFRARLLNKLMSWELAARAASQTFHRTFPRIRGALPLVFTDPLQVFFYELKANDTVIVHDMGPVTHPDLYEAGVFETYSRVFEQISIIAPHVIFVSKASKSQYESIYGARYSSVHVVYPGLRFELLSTETEPLPEVQSPFLLTVGAVGTRKNQLGALQAFQRSGLPELGFSYVICGGREPGFEAVQEYASGLPWAHLTGYVTGPQLQWLYGHAQGFVLPSLLEGFGIPAAEAIFKGLIPLVSGWGALHEVTGDSAVIVDPHDISSIAHGMRELAMMPLEEKETRLASLRHHISFFTADRAREGWRQAILNQL